MADKAKKRTDILGVPSLRSIGISGGERLGLPAIQTNGTDLRITPPIKRNIMEDIRGAGVTPVGGITVPAAPQTPLMFTNEAPGGMLGRLTPGETIYSTATGRGPTGEMLTSPSITPWKPTGGMAEGSAGTAFTPIGAGAVTPTMEALLRKRGERGTERIGQLTTGMPSGAATSLKAGYDEYVNRVKAAGKAAPIGMAEWVKDQAKQSPETMQTAVSGGYINQPPAGEMPQQTLLNQWMKERKDAGRPITGEWLAQASEAAIRTVAPTGKSPEEIEKLKAETGQIGAMGQYYAQRATGEATQRKHQADLMASIDRNRKLRDATFDEKQKAVYNREIAALQSQLTGAPMQSQEAEPKDEFADILSRLGGK